MIYQISPGKTFESKDGVCSVTSIVISVPVGLDYIFVSAVSGKRICVIGGVVYSNGAFTQVTFKNGAGGTPLRSLAIPANTVATPNVPVIATPWDVFETAPGIALAVDNSAVIAIVTLNYITYTP